LLRQHTHFFLSSSFSSKFWLIKFINMRVFKDLLTNDEMFTDAYKYKLVDEVIYEVVGRYETRKDGEVQLAGSNPSAEEADEGTDETAVSGVNIVLDNRLTETGFGDKKAYTLYLKEYMKKLVEKLTENAPDQVPIFKENMNKVMKDLLQRFKDFQFFTGESMNPDGMIALMEYRDIDGASVPVMMFFKHGLEEEKL